MKKTLYILVSLIFLFFSCKSSNIPSGENNNTDNKIATLISEPIPSSEEKNNKKDKNTITLLFGGDIMAHNENYNISSYDKIWNDIKDVVSEADFAFANIESPIDTTKKVSSYPDFNRMPLIKTIKICIIIINKVI